MDPAVEIRALRCGYGPGAFELRLDALRLERGAAAALIGPSGSGKSTLLHAIAGVVPARAERLGVLGLELAGASDAERRALRLARIGLVFQRLELVEYLSVLDNLTLPLRLGRRGPPTSTEIARARELAGALGLSERLAERPAELSGGERQRVALARALVPEPELVLADEPTGSLDPDNAERALALLFEDSRRRGAALLLVTHDHGQLARFETVHELGVASPGARP